MTAKPSWDASVQLASASMSESDAGTCGNVGQRFDREVAGIQRSAITVLTCGRVETYQRTGQCARAPGQV